MAKGQELVPSVGEQVMPGLNLQAMRRSVLISGGLVSPRRKYTSREERKAAAKERSKERREARKTFLEERGLAPKPRVKISKAQKKVRSKELRRMRNIYLREHPEEARTIGIDIGRLRV